MMNRYYKRIWCWQRECLNFNVEVSKAGGTKVQKKSVWTLDLESVLFSGARENNIAWRREHHDFLFNELCAWMKLIHLSECKFTHTASASGTNYLTDFCLLWVCKNMKEKSRADISGSSISGLKNFRYILIRMVSTNFPSKVLLLKINFFSQKIIWLQNISRLRHYR